MKIETAKVTHMDVSSKQLVSIVTGLIPFLSMMMLTALLWVLTCNAKAFLFLKPDAPIVGTGLEARAARDSGAVIVAEEDGIVEFVDGFKIVIAPKA